ncbi:MAG: hypothetical protein O7B99_04250 [Planctomycetota bacterium]|nr:hypothetical protein [Planctomycetota bacterium]
MSPFRPRPCARLAAVVVLFLLGIAAPVLADVLVLDDGRRIEGTILAETATRIEIKTSFGTYEFPRKDVVEIIRGKTRDQEYEELLAACKSGEDFYQLGLWCEENKLRKRAQKIYARAIDIDPEHQGARLKLGFVLYKGEWMTPAERDERHAADLAAEMEAKGLVEHEGRWVTPEDKAKLEQGLVLHEGDWLPLAEAMRRKGFEEYAGKWLPRAEALARRGAEGLIEKTGVQLEIHIANEAVFIGSASLSLMEMTGRGLDKGRAWFDEKWKVEPGLHLYGNRLAEFYVFDMESEPFYASADYVAERSNHIPAGWAEAVKKTHGFIWIDPISISVARQWNRNEGDLVGHSYHHLGHLMLNRLGYQHRLLPPWYDEGVACLCELRIHEQSTVFCRAAVEAVSGTVSDVGRPVFEAGNMRDGSWRLALGKAIRNGQILPFDKLAQREFSQLDMIDIATSIVIVEWLESRGGDTMREFHKVLRKRAPEAPLRVIRSGHERQACYDEAFQKAVGMGFRQADAEWRRWFLSP